MGVGAGLYMCDVVKKVHVRYRISWWVLVILFYSESKTWMFWDSVERQAYHSLIYVRAFLIMLYRTSEWQKSGKHTCTYLQSASSSRCTNKTDPTNNVQSTSANNVCISYIPVLRRRGLGSNFCPGASNAGILADNIHHRDLARNHSSALGNFPFESTGKYCCGTESCVL